jgi:hypothetical protein
MFYATHACILTSVHSSAPHGTPSPLTERSPTALSIDKTHGFGIILSPVTFSAQDHLTSKLLRTF